MQLLQRMLLHVQQMMQNADMIGAAEAAGILRRDATTVQRWARGGKLPVAFKMPGATGALLFNREDVEALAKADAA